ncbi:MAG: hypothetical protein L6265_05740, partial [Thermoplasmatales archaeon]|nr:hypothetical protein [Thermoplasmatales archaeon]
MSNKKKSDGIKKGLIVSLIGAVLLMGIFAMIPNAEAWITDDTPNVGGDAPAIVKEESDVTLAWNLKLSNNSGGGDSYLKFVNVTIQEAGGSGFTMSDLNGLTTASNSGISFWKESTATMGFQSGEDVEVGLTINSGDLPGNEWWVNITCSELLPSAEPANWNFYICFRTNSTATDGHAFAVSLNLGGNEFGAQDATGYWHYAPYNNNYGNTINIDTIPPTVPGMLSEPKYTTGTQNTVNCTAATDNSTPIQYEFERDVDDSFLSAVSSGWSNNNYATFTGLTHAQIYYYKVRARDAYGSTDTGHVSAWNTTYVNSTQDNYAPATPSMNAEPTYTQGLSNNVSCTIVIDNVSNPVEYKFEMNITENFGEPINNSGWISTNWVIFNDLGDGNKYFYRVQARDAASLTTGWSGIVNSIQDDTAPVTTLSIAEEVHPDGGADGCNVTNSTVFTLSATDTGSGVDFTWYTIDGNYFVGASFTLTGYAEGTHTITWGSQDNVTNNETGNSYTIWLDDTPPTTTPTVAEEVHPDAGASGCNITSSTDITLTATDLPAHNAGVKKVWYYVNDVGNY